MGNIRGVAANFTVAREPREFPQEISGHLRDHGDVEAGCRNSTIKDH
jgi:hypothetical protein